MQSQIGVIYMWNGQEIVNYHPTNCEHATITKRVGPQKTCTRIIYIKGKQLGWTTNQLPLRRNLPPRRKRTEKHTHMHSRRRRRHKHTTRKYGNRLLLAPRFSTRYLHNALHALTVDKKMRGWNRSPRQLRQSCSTPSRWTRNTSSLTITSNMKVIIGEGKIEQLYCIESD